MKLGTLGQRARRRLAVTLVEVMIASALSLTVTLTALGSVVYYQRTSAKNDRLTAVANLLESQLENVRNRTWSSLDASPSGIMPPGGGTNFNWPAPGATPVRYECVPLRRTLVADALFSSGDLTGTVRTFYTPFSQIHVANNRDGSRVGYEIRYYKIEVEVVLDEICRISPGTGPETFQAVTYISEMQGRNTPEYNQRTIGLLRESRQRVVP
jgi:type II secretory pathway pseudopilin PulG